MKKYGDAEKWLKKALDLTEQLYGEDHPACVLVHMGFANLYQLQHNLEEAEAHLVRAWEIKEDECHQDGGIDGENEELAEIYSELGKVHSKQDDQDDQALECYKHALAIYQARLGAETPQVGRIAQKVATLQSKLGYFDDSVANFELAAGALEVHNGACHKKTVDVWRKLCLLLVKLKRFEDAQSLLLRVINSEKVLFGAMSINLVESYKLLAMVYKVDGKMQDMIRIHEAVLTIYHKKWGPKDSRSRDLAKQVADMKVQLRMKIAAEVEHDGIEDSECSSMK